MFVISLDKVTVYRFSRETDYTYMQIFVVFPLVKENIEIYLTFAYRFNFL
jgi:hypothetical protein